MQGRLALIVVIIALFADAVLAAERAEGNVWFEVLGMGNVSSGSTYSTNFDLSGAISWDIYLNLTGYAVPVWETWCSTRNMTSRYYLCNVYTQYMCTVYTKYGCTIVCTKTGNSSSSPVTIPTCTTSGQGESPSCSCSKKLTATYSGTHYCVSPPYYVQSSTVGYGGMRVSYPWLNVTAYIERSDGAQRTSCMGSTSSSSYTQCSGPNYCWGGCCNIGTFTCYFSTSLSATCSTAWDTACTPGASYYWYVGALYGGYCTCFAPGPVTTLCYTDSACSTSTAPAIQLGGTSYSGLAEYKVDASYTISPDTSCTGVCPSGWSLTTCSGCVCNKNPQSQNTGSTKCGTYSGCSCDAASCTCSAGRQSQNTGSTKCGTYSGCSCDAASCTCYISSYTPWTDTKCGDGQITYCTGACAPGGSCDTGDLKECNSATCYYKNVGNDFPDYPEFNVSNTRVYRGGVNFQNATFISLNQYLIRGVNEFRIYGGSTGDRVEWKYFGLVERRWNLTISAGTREQDVELASSLDTQYIRKPYTISIPFYVHSNATNITWEGECDYGVCTVNSGYISYIPRSGSVAVYAKWYADNLTESWGEWKQYTGRVTYAGGTAWISKNLGVQNGDSSVNFVNVMYSGSGRAGWDCYNVSGYINVSAGNNVYNDLIVCSRENVINVTGVVIKQVGARVGERIRWWLNDTWNNTDSEITFSNITKVYVLPDGCSDVRIFVNGVEQTTNTSMVSINGCTVTIFNITLGPHQSIDPDITYLTPEVVEEEGSFIVEGVLKLNEPVPWKKNVYIRNTGGQGYTNITANATISASTVQNTVSLTLYKRNETVVDIPWNFEMSGNHIIWNFSINPYENQTWVIRLKTVAPRIYQINESNDFFAAWINITGAEDLEYPSVLAYAPIGGTIREQTSFYDNTSGTPVEISMNSSYGPPAFNDTDGDFMCDRVEWYVPRIPAGGNATFFLNGTKGKAVVCRTVDRKIINAPLRSGENVVWNYSVLCSNPNPIDIQIGRRPVSFRVPLGSFEARVDGIPVDILFGMFGAYIELPTMHHKMNNIKTVIPAYGSVNFSVSLKTPAFTKHEEIFLPREQWVGERMLVKKNVEFRNWGDENLSDIKEPVELGYVENVRIYEGERLVATIPEVLGTYLLEIPVLLPNEIRKFSIYYETETAKAEDVGSYKDVINGTLTQINQMRVLSSSPMPLSNLRMKVRVYPSCIAVLGVWEVEDIFAAQPLREVEYECNGNDLVINVGRLSVGGVKYIRIFLKAEERMEMPRMENFFDFLYRYLHGFLRYLWDLISGLVGNLTSIFRGIFPAFP